MFTKLSFSTNAYTVYSITDAITRIARCGYQGVELLADAPHLFLGDGLPANLAAIKTSLQSANLKVASINANTASGYYRNAPPEPIFEPSMSNPSEELRRWRIEYSKKAVDLAVEVGASVVSITSGRCMMGLPPEKAVEIFKESLAEVLAWTAPKKICLAIEYEPGLVIENATEVAAIIKDMAHPALGVNLDIGHAEVCGENIPQVIEKLGDKIFHLHLEDIRDRKHYHRIPGEGDIDFTAVGRALDRIGFQSFTTVELYNHTNNPDNAAARSFAYLSKIGD